VSVSEWPRITVKSFHGDGYSDVGRQAFAWAEEHHGLDLELWAEVERWDGGRIAEHPSGFRVRAWVSTSGVDGVLEA
jgi:hypothetical protein